MNEPSGRMVPQLSGAKAALLEQWREGTGFPGALSIPRCSRSGPLPLSLQQERLWLFEQLEPGTTAYNLSFCARMARNLEPELLSRSLEDLVDRHETLRTTVRLRRGEPCQLVDEGARPVLQVVDLRRLGEDAGVAEAVAGAAAAVNEPFDLETGPLARMVLWRVPGGDVLVLAVHHLIADGWSLGVALRELSSLYEARAAGRLPSLPALPIRYRDFCVWQREGASEQEWDQDLAYWREQLQGLSPLELPTDWPRPPVMTSRGDWRELRMPDRLSRTLRTLAREEQATLFMVVLAAWKILMARISGQRDIVVGTNIANRAHPETFGIIGNFANTLALRTNLGGDPTFRESIRRVKATCLGAFSRQQLPFERLVDALRLRQELSGGPLFEALFLLQPPLTDVRFAGAEMEQIQLGWRSVRADLELHLHDGEDVNGGVAFSTELFEPATVERLLERFQMLLGEIVSDPGVRMSDAPVVLTAERRLLRAWGQGPTRESPAIGVHELVSRRAERSPGATAVVSSDRLLTYEQLRRRANQLAHHLRALDVGPEVRVAICLDRSVEMVAAILGVLKAGGAYVPLDPRHPPARLTAMVEDCGASVMVTEAALAGRVTVPDMTVVCLDRDRDAINSRPHGDPAVLVDAENLAYVLYTSGSTGAPKGVQVEHRALTNLVLSIVDLQGVEAGDVMAAVASFSFDASIAEMFPPLVVGGTVVVATADEAADGERLQKLVMSNGVTVMSATATTWRLLLSAGGVGRRGIKAICGGEPVTPDLAHRLAAGQDCAWHTYGPTETTVWSTAQRLTPTGRVSLGCPITNTTVQVLDDELREVPIGVVGEVCIGGAGLSRGYLNHPGLTAVRFVPDPFASAPGARLYRTGDLARYRLDGTLDFAGRRDNQVKLRGQRIELGEIEANLSLHPAVAQAVAVLRESVPDDAALVAYVIPAPEVGARSNAELATSLTRYLRERLPGYMVPSTFVFQAEFPETATGKIDRKNLPAPPRAGEQTAEYIRPRTALEAEIATSAAELLGLDRVGIRDDFFALGGHSLLAARLIAQLQERHGISLSPTELFMVPTVERVAELIERELARTSHFASEHGRLRLVVDGMPEETVDALLGAFLAQQPPGSEDG